MLTILHLSDLQFGRVHRYGEPKPGDNPYDTLIERLKEELSQLREQHQLVPDLVIVTGDLAEWGMPQEFAKVATFLDALQSHLGLVRKRIVVVPGNHDINRKLCESYFNEREGIGETPLPPFVRKWQPWIHFFEAFYKGIGGVEFRPEQPWTFFEFPDLRVVIAGLNSTICESHREKDHYGWVGEEQLKWFSERLQDYRRRGWFRVAAIHHNVQRGAERDDENLRDADTMRRILGPHLNLVLHGHTHEAAEGWWGRDLPILSTGSAAVKQEARPLEVPNQCQVLIIRRDGFERITREYASEQKRWIAATRHSATGEQWRIQQNVSFEDVDGTFRPEEPNASIPNEACDSHVIEEMEERSLGDGFVDRVVTVCRARDERANIQIRNSPHLSFPWLEVVTCRDDIVDACSIAALTGLVTEKDIASFLKHVIEPRRQIDRGQRAVVVVGGNQPIPDAIRSLGRQSNIRIESFISFQGLIDFGEYLVTQNRRLDNDPIYPPTLYVPQRVKVGLRDPRLMEDALEEVRSWLEDDDHGRLALLLGSFGVGKTFLLRRLARLLANGPRVPVLVDLRRLDKSLSLSGMLAAHFTDVRGYTPNKFEYMLREGRIVLLFDGFDELAMRVSYRRAADHLDVLLSAATDRAKVVITSRTEHFISDKQVESRLMADARRIPTLRVGVLQPFDGDRIRHFLLNYFNGNEIEASRRYRQLDRVKDLLGLSNNPRMLGFIVRLPAERLDAAEQREGGISAATLYREIIDHWLGYEIQRANPKGSPEGLSKEQCLDALRHLAERLWMRTERAIGLDELSEGVAQALGRLDHLEPEVATQLVGSGTLLVRDSEGRFSFLHQSVLEWLVADIAARRLVADNEEEVLERAEMSMLMVEFLCDIVGRTRIIEWARGVLILRKNKSDATQKNALAVLRWLDENEGTGATLSGADLEGQDLSGRNLRGANLQGANLRSARLVSTDLTGATLANAVLVNAVLDGAQLRNADLTGVNATGARFVGADLEGARLDRAVLQRAALLGAHILPNQLEQVGNYFGAAVPSSDFSAVHPVLASAPGYVGAVAWSPDGELLATGNADGTVRLWSASDGGLLRILEGGNGSVGVVGFLSEGQQLVSGCDDGTLRLWSVSTGEILRTLHTRDRRVYDLAFSPTRQLFAISVDDGIRLWSLPEGALLKAIKGDSYWHNRGLAFSPDGKVLVSCDSEDKINFWSADGGTLLKSIERHYDDGIMHLSFSPNGLYMSFGSRNGTVRVLSVADYEVLRTLEGHHEWVRNVEFSPDGLYLASGDITGKICLWSIVDGRRVAMLEGQLDGIASLAFSSDGLCLAAGGTDGTIRLWSVPDGRALRTLNESSSGFWRASISPNGKHFMNCSTNGVIRVRSLSNGALEQVTKVDGDKHAPMAFSQDHQYLAWGSRNGLIRLWSMSDGQIVRTLDTDSRRVEALDFSRDGRLLVGGGYRNSIRLWSIPDGKSTLRIDTNKLDMRIHGGLRVKFSNDGLLLATGHYGRVQIWSVQDGSVVAALDLGESNVSPTSLAFSPDDRHFAIGLGGDVYLYSTRNWKLSRKLQGHLRMVQSLAFSSDGGLLASGGADGTICLWSMPGGRNGKTLDRHHRAMSMTFSPDGGLLYTAGVDGTLRLWNTSAGTLLSTVLLLDEDAWVLVTPDGRHHTQGEIGDSFAYAVNLVRFTPKELAQLRPNLRLPDDVGFFGPFD